jgi:hypothetical protein
MRSNLVTKVAVDVAMTATLAASLATGIALWLFIPSGQHSGTYILLGLTKELWNDIHLYSSLGFAATLLIHLALTLKLFVSMTKCLMLPNPAPA